MANRKCDYDQGTARVLHSMMTENTGRHFLDSGGAYGRNWERNQGLTLKDLLSRPDATLDVTCGSLNMGLDVFKFLLRSCTFNAKLDRKFQRFCNRRENRDDHWLALMEKFTEEEVPGASGIYNEGNPFTVNTYNHESLLSQVIQYRYWTDEDGEHALIQIHGGCDVRGGYTKPRAFDVDTEYGSSFLRDDYAGLACDHKPSPTPQRTLPIDGPSQDEEECEASWYTDDGYHWYANDDGPDGLEHMEFIDVQDLPEDERDPVALVKARGSNRALFYDSEANVAYCPVCGSPLKAWPY